MTDMLADQDTMAGVDGPGRGQATALPGLTDPQVRVALAPPVRVSLAPLMTVTSLMLEAVGLRRGSPAAWHGPIRRVLDPDDIALIAPLIGGRGSMFIPDCLVPLPVDLAPGFGEELERVAATPAEALIADLDAHGLLDTGWSTSTRAPRRWLSAYVACLGRAWIGARPLWERARPLLEKEFDRIGGALARGTFDILLGELSPRITVGDGGWYMHGHPAPITFAPGMMLTPMISGPHALFLADRNDVVHELAYPLRAAWQLGGAPAETGGPDSLQALLGEPRAHLLRRLDRAVTAGSLAVSMLYAPSAISHHLVALERAGLVRRERNGRHVLVHRTDRGTALVGLYDS